VKTAAQMAGYAENPDVTHTAWYDTFGGGSDCDKSESVNTSYAGQPTYDYNVGTSAYVNDHANDGYNFNYVFNRVGGSRAFNFSTFYLGFIWFNCSSF
jgi:hypothetical protein